MCVALKWSHLVTAPDILIFPKELFVTNLSLNPVNLFLLVVITWSINNVSADERLIDAVKDRDHTAIDTLLKEKVDVDQTHSDGATALAWAAYWDDLETAQRLVRAGANTNIANDYGITPLMLACNNGSAEMVSRLIEARADPNLVQWMGVTPLMLCARSGSTEAVLALLNQGANPDIRDKQRGQTALMWAASRQQHDIANVLTEYGANTNIITKMPEGFKPREFITYGINYRDPTKTDVIGDDDVHPDYTSSRGGFTALMFAAQKGDTEMARLLVNAGANINIQSEEYGSALLVAVLNSNMNTGLYLLDQGANPTVQDHWGFSPLHYALFDGIVAIGMSRTRIPSDEIWLRHNLPEVVESLLVHGADPNARVGRGISPFSYPAFARTTGNAMPEIRQPGATPFLLASASLDINLMQLLLEYGADPLLTTNEGTTPMMVAAGMGRQEELTADEKLAAVSAVTLLWEHGIDINASNQDGRTALAAAAYQGADDVIEFLVEKGANMEAKDRYGQTALSIAMGKPYKITGGDKRFRRASLHQSSVDLLLSLGAKPID
jgi:uncharacterized protein